MNGSNLLQIFPNLATTQFKITSPPSNFYNCIAWAYGRSDIKIWPNAIRGYLWPADIPRTETIEAFVQLFESQGFSICDDSLLVPGHEKIAIFADANKIPQHAAKQLSNGRWSSKLGKLEDIEHEISGVEESEYGTAVVFMVRPL